MPLTAASVTRLRATHARAVHDHHATVASESREISISMLKYARQHTRWRSRSGTQKDKIRRYVRITRRQHRMILRGLPTTTKWGTANVLAILEKGSRPHIIRARFHPTKGRGFGFRAGAKYLAIPGVGFRVSVQHPGTRPYWTLRGAWEAQSRIVPGRYKSAMARVASRFGTS